MKPQHERTGVDPGMRLRLNLWLENEHGESLFGSGRRQILEAVRARGSLSGAAEELGMSYRALWAKLRRTERRLGFALVEAHAGRGPHSGTTLTPAAEALLAGFTRLQGDVTRSAQAAFNRFREAFPH